MSKRERYDDNFTGNADRRLRALIFSKDEDEDNRNKREKLKHIMLKVINNELTPRQKEIIMLYYFKNYDIVEIGKMLGITPQAVSAAMARGRQRMFRILQYYI